MEKDEDVNQEDENDITSKNKKTWDSSACIKVEETEKTKSKVWGPPIEETEEESKAWENPTIEQVETNKVTEQIDPIKTQETQTESVQEQAFVTIENSYIAKVSCTNPIVVEKVSFSNCIIDVVEFHKDVDLKNCEFHNGGDFTKAQFEEEIENKDNLVNLRQNFVSDEEEIEEIENKDNLVNLRQNFVSDEEEIEETQIISLPVRNRVRMASGSNFTPNYTKNESARIFKFYDTGQIKNPSYNQEIPKKEKDNLYKILVSIFAIAILVIFTISMMYVKLQHEKKISDTEKMKGTNISQNWNVDEENKEVALSFYNKGGYRSNLRIEIELLNYRFDGKKNWKENIHIGKENGALLEQLKKDINVITQRDKLIVMNLQLPQNSFCKVTILNNSLSRYQRVVTRIFYPGDISEEKEQQFYWY